MPPPVNTELSAELLAQVLDTNATGSIIIDYNNRIQFWNKWIEKSSLIDKENALGKKLFTLFPQLNGSRIHKAIELSLTKGNASFISHAFNKNPFPLFSHGDKDKPIHQTIYIKPIQLKNESRFCFIQINDSSTSVYREKQLKKLAVEANDLSKLKSGFVSSVSHELRTPLTSIMGALGLLKSGVEAPNSPTYSRMMDIAFSNAERLLLLISDILDIEKIESGEIDFKFIEADINELVDNCISQNHGLAEKYNVRFNFIKEQSLPSLLFDKDRIFQVLNNLLSNAAKFEPNNGVIDVKSSLEKNNIRVSVTDHGAGIPDEFRSRIFQAFTQADVSNTKGVAGTGLGLAITKSIIEQHDGKIDFESKPNKETSFYFTLPLLKK